MQLNPNTYLTVEETKAWLNLKADVTEFDSVIARLINVATERVEQYIEGPVLNQRFVEVADGSNTDVILPKVFPVVGVEEIKIDYNQAFATAIPLDPTVYSLRGTPKPNNVAGNFAVYVKGTDIVLRGDNSSSIIGRIFMGSAVQSVQVVYTAGWGATSADLPSDLVHATLLLVEHYYMVKTRRSLNLTSQSTNGQSFSITAGMPKEIAEILEDYRDYSFGTTNTKAKIYGA